MDSLAGAVSMAGGPWPLVPARTPAAVAVGGTDVMVTH